MMGVSDRSDDDLPILWVNSLQPAQSEAGLLALAGELIPPVIEIRAGSRLISDQRHDRIIVRYAATPRFLFLGRIRRRSAFLRR